MAQNKKKERVEIFNLRILDINVAQFSQFELKKEFKKDIFPLVEFQSDFDFKIIEEEEKVTCTISIKIRILETGEYFGEAVIATSFLVTPLQSVITKDNKGIITNINRLVLHNIAAISASTVRGIFSERFKGSLIQKDIYPLINIAELFAENEK